jgi:hypothetical protein
VERRVLRLLRLLRLRLRLRLLLLRPPWCRRPEYAILWLLLTPAPAGAIIVDRSTPRAGVTIHDHEQGPHATLTGTTGNTGIEPAGGPGACGTAPGLARANRGAHALDPGVSAL